MDSEKTKTEENGGCVHVDKQKLYPILKFFAGTGGRIILTVVFAAIIYGIAIAGLEYGSEAVIIVILLACGFFGWQSLNKITPSLFLWMPAISWLIYFLVKGLLSLFIGAFVAPVWIGKKYRQR